MMDYWKSLHRNRNRRRREVTARFENETSPGEERHRYVKARLDKIEARLDKVETLAEECAQQYERSIFLK